LDDGERAHLKRNAGKSLADADKVQLLFYRLLPYDLGAKWQEDRYFLVATLYPFDRDQRERDRQARSAATQPPPAEPAADSAPANASAGSLGRSFRLIRREENSVGLDKRVARLLDADSEQLPFQLRQAIRLLTSAAERPVIDWAQLTLDVLRWGNPARAVQRRWARDYVAREPQAQASPTETH
jgi:CRISPR type I-E-associated protein CasB/Cse2